MIDREKVIKGLECCMAEKICASKCPYKGQCDDGGYYYSKAIEDAISLLKEQEPRVMTLEEVEDALDSVVWVDRPLFDNLSNEYALIDSYSRKLQIVELRYPFYDKDYRERSDYVTYGKTWRCWTSRPTDEQREAIPWKD